MISDRWILVSGIKNKTKTCLFFNLSPTYQSCQIMNSLKSLLLPNGNNTMLISLYFNVIVKLHGIITWEKNSCNVLICWPHVQDWLILDSIGIWNVNIIVKRFLVLLTLYESLHAESQNQSRIVLCSPSLPTHLETEPFPYFLSGFRVDWVISLFAPRPRREKWERSWNKKLEPLLFPQE